MLVERGVPFADKIPAVNAQFVVLQSESLAKAQTAIRLLDLLRVVLPVLAILALIAGVALAPARRRALVIGASMIVGTLVLLLLGVQLLRALYLDDLEKALLVPRVATVVFDDVTTPLRVWVRSSAMLFLLIALAAWAAGPSSAAAAVRSVPARLSALTSTPTGALGSVARFAARNTVALRAAVGGLAVLALLVGDRPSAGGVLLIAVLAAARPDRRRGAASLGRRGSGRCGTRHPRMPRRRRERPPSPGGGRRGGRPRAAGPRS